MKLRLAFLIAACLGGAVPAWAQAAGGDAPFAGLGEDSDKPIEISAKTQQADFKAETITYLGDVRIQQGSLILRADKVEGSAPKGRLSKITATGNVVITSQDATARCPTAIYDITARKLRLTGGVVLTQGPNTIRGTDLVVDLASSTAVLTAEGGRVDGVLQPSN